MSLLDCIVHLHLCRKNPMDYISMVFLLVISPLFKSIHKLPAEYIEPRVLIQDKWYIYIVLTYLKLMILFP